MLGFTAFIGGCVLAYFVGLGVYHYITKRSATKGATNARLRRKP